MNNEFRFPAWVCETHTRELDDLITSGEISEAREVWENNRRNWSNFCLDCVELSKAEDIRLGLK